MLLGIQGPLGVIILRIQCQKRDRKLLESHLILILSKILEPLQWINKLQKK